MDEDASSLTLAVIINLIIYIVIPLIMAYRRGYFINVGGKLCYYWDIITKNTAHYPKDWTNTKTRPLSKFEKAQIKNISVRFMPDNRKGYWVEIILKSEKTLLYSLADRKNYWIDDKISPDKLLLRIWQKAGEKTYFDVIPTE